MRENGVDSPYLFLYPGFTIVACLPGGNVADKKFNIAG